MSDGPSLSPDRNGARFGVFEVDFRTGELRKSGIRIRLQEQPFLILAALLERPGELITREELRGRLWSDVTFMDFDHGINVAVKKLRAALNDSVDYPRYIETLGSKGYRFIAPVELLGAPAADIEPTSAQSVPSRPKGALRRVFAIGAAGVALFLGALAVWLLGARESGVSSNRFKPFATEAVEETWPTWSQDGKTIAYLAQVKGVTQIFTRTLGSAIPVQITKSLQNCESVFWHPGGSRLYYTSAGTLWSIGAAGGKPQLVEDAMAGTISPDGNTLATIRGGDGPAASLWITGTRDTTGKPYKQAPFPETFREGAVAKFSPDGSKIGVALGVDTGGPGYEFWIIPFPSGRPRRALASTKEHAPLSGFSWMPDSRYVILGAELPGIAGSHLYSVDTEKGTFAQITSGTTEEAQPSVSPDGKTVAFVSGGTDFDLIDVPLDGGPIRTLLATSRNEIGPAWSPSGGQYVYATNANGSEEIWLRALEDGWARPVVATGAPGLPAGYLLGRPQFSPDGMKIVYNVWGLNHSVWISALGGGPPVRVEPESLDQHGPSWSPDGNWIAYARLQVDKWAMVKTPIGGGPPITLREGAFTFHTKWSPNDEWICYSSPRGLQLVSTDGKAHRILNKSTSENFDFSRDGATLYYLNQGTRNWAVVAIDVRSGEERKVSDLAIPSTTMLGGFSLNPNGKSFATSAGTTKLDIWLLEGFERPSRGWLFGNTQK